MRLQQFDGMKAQAGMKPLPRPDRRAPDRPGQARLGAVLLLLYDKEGEIHFVLTRRRDDLNSHAGQMALPGGRREAQESLQETALREAHEEVGVHPQGVTILGELTPLYIMPSDFEVHPYVGWHAEPPLLVPQDAEVAEIVEVPVHQLLDEATRGREMWEMRGIRLEVPFFRVGEHKVWGATAMMLSEFLERIRLVIGKNGSSA